MSDENTERAALQSAIDDVCKWVERDYADLPKGPVRDSIMRLSKADAALQDRQRREATSAPGGADEFRGLIEKHYATFDAEGLVEPKDPFSWETLARVTFDHAVAALAAAPASAPEPVGALTEAFKDVLAHLAGAASAYRMYAKRHSSQGKAETDALFSTRAKDFDAAVERGRAALLAALSQQPAAEPVARLLEWIGPDEMRPLGPQRRIARTFEEFPATPGAARYWREVGKLYAEPVAAKADGGETDTERLAWLNTNNGRSWDLLRSIEYGDLDGFRRWIDQGMNCICGNPSSPHTVHRTDGPCYMKEPPMSKPDQFSATRYPYTYACDFVRSFVTDYDEEIGMRTPTLSRGEASQAMKAFEAVFGLTHEQMASKLADFYMELEGIQR